MTIFTTFISLTGLTAMLAAEAFLLAATDGASAKDGWSRCPPRSSDRRMQCIRYLASVPPNLIPGAIGNHSAGHVVPASVTNWNTFTKLPRIIVMVIAGAILLTATGGTLAKNEGDNAIKNNNVERSGVGKEKHKEKRKGAGAGTVTATGNRLVVSPPAYGPPAGGAGVY